MADLQCVVLAGGLATRMRPATERLPKWLIPVAGRPFAEWQLEWLASQGVDRVLAAIGYRGEQIKNHLGDGQQFGVHITYSTDGPELLGTGGALRLAAGRGLLDERFLIMYGDSYLAVDVAAVWKPRAMSGHAALMTVYEDRAEEAANNVCYRSGEVVAYSKTPAAGDPGDATLRHTDYGLSVFNRTTIEALPRHTVIDLADVFEDLAAAGALAGYEVAERFHEVGSPGGLADLERLLTLCGPDACP